jgi:hypothetical protein
VALQDEDASQMMGATARLHPHKARRNLGEGPNQVGP